MDFDFVSKSMSAVPSKTWRSGDRIGRSNLRHASDGWSIEIPRQYSTSIEASVEEILALVKSGADWIKTLDKNFEIHLEISLAVYIQDQSPSCNICKDTLKALADLGVDLDIDIIMICS